MPKNLVPSSQETMYSDVITDILTLARIVQTTLEEITLEMWNQRGMHVRSSEWTLHQTMAHLVAVAEFYRSALQHALLHQHPVILDFQQRKDLPAYNQREILCRQHMSPSELITALHQALVGTVEIAQQLTPEQFSWPVAVPAFNRPLTTLDILEAQTTHVGIVHAAQITRPVGKDPLWLGYEPSFLHRMLARFFRLMSLTYWTERGGELRATLQFLVAGSAGGEWHLTISPTGAQANIGRAPKPQVTLWAANADALCLLFTGQISIGQALLRRKLFVWGNLYLATRLGELFSPT